MFKKSKIIFLFIVILHIACSSDNGEEYQEVKPLITLPGNFPLFPDSETNPLTKAGVALGKKLFFDTKLSATNTVSCASCHHPNLAFTDGVALGNNGVSGNFLLRSAPSLVNLAWAKNGLFWDGGSTNLESQAFAPLSHPDEMFQNLDELIEELNTDATYIILFEKAFQTSINQVGVVKALAQFQRTLVSGNSKYDKYTRGEAGGNLSADEKEGLALAEKHCFSCHEGPLLTDNLYHNNGLDATFLDTSHEGLFLGRFRITRNPEDLGKYKTPTLRNIEKTAPYMHDGRFTTLEAVLEHYASGVQYSKTLDSVLQNKDGVGVRLSENEKIKIIAFLKTVTDYQFLEDDRFSEL